jgi:hypothetical protein
VVLIYPFPLQIDKLRFAVEEYIAHPNIGHIYLYIGDQKVLEGAKRAVEKLKVAQVVTVRALPISDTERALRARRRA